MTEETISQEFILQNIDKTRNYFVKEVEENELMSKKHNIVFATLNYIEHFLILAFTITGCIFIFKTKNERIMLLSKCTLRDSKRSKFIKEQEPSRLLSSFGIRTPLSKIPFVGPLSF